MNALSSHMQRMRFRLNLMALTTFAMLALSCKQHDRSADVDSSFIGNVSSEARRALATAVDFQLTEENFSKWESAQQNLDVVPESQLAPVQPSGGDVIDAAVARLQSSPRAKRAIEAAGLSVRDFVLETVALAQAVQASATGRSTLQSGIPAANFAFVERYRERIREAGIPAATADQTPDQEVTDSNTIAELERARADSARNAKTDSGSGDTITRPPAPIRRDSTGDT